MLVLIIWRQTSQPSLEVELGWSILGKTLVLLFGKHSGKSFGPSVSQWRNNQWRLNRLSWNKDCNQQAEHPLPPEPEIYSSAVAQRSSTASPSEAQAFGQLTLPGSLGKTNLVWPFNSNYTGCLSKNENYLRVILPPTNTRYLWIISLAFIPLKNKVDLTNTVMFLMTCSLVIW